MPDDDLTPGTIVEVSYMLRAPERARVVGPGYGGLWIEVEDLAEVEGEGARFDVLRSRVTVVEAA